MGSEGKRPELSDLIEQELRARQIRAIRKFDGFVFEGSMYDWIREFPNTFESEESKTLIWKMINGQTETESWHVSLVTDGE